MGGESYGLGSCLDLKRIQIFYLMDPKTNDFQIASGMDDIIELNYQNLKMREAMIEAMKYWVRETDIDGFRCDLASWVEVDFWQQAKPEVETIKPLFFG